MPAVLCVDLEPDDRELAVPSAPSWPGADALLADDAWLRDAMGDRSAPVNWFVRCDPQVEACHGSADWALERYAARLDALAATGDEVGLHPHNWRWHADGRRWSVDNGDDWAEHCVEVALAGYERVLGRPCRAYRHGDRFMSDAIARRLLASSVEVDLTLEPGPPAVRDAVPGVPTSGITPHVDQALVRPFQPSPDDFTVPDERSDGRLTMVPLTTGLVAHGPAPETAYLWREPEAFAAQLDLLLLDTRRRHLAFAIRSDMALPSWWRTNIERNLRVLAARVPALRWVPATEAARATRRAPDDDEHDPGPLGALVAAFEERAAQVARSEAELAALRVAVADLDTRLAAMEATITWRTRNRLLPVLRRVRRPRS